MKYDLISCGPFGQEFCDWVHKDYSQFVSCRYKENLQQSDLKGINAIAGFYQFDGLDLSSIRWIHGFGAGVDDYLRQPTTPTDLILTRTIGYMDQRIGEYCLTYILEDLKGVIRTFENQLKQQWIRRNLDVLYNKRVLLFGTGAIGLGIANILAPLVGEITGVNRSGRVPSPLANVISFEELPESSLKTYDIVINALPLTIETLGYFDRQFFDRLNQALFINVGRGKSVREEDIIPAIEKGSLRQAVLDVFLDEPLSADSPLWKHSQVLVTPHFAGLTTLADIQKSFRECVDAMKNGTTNHLFVNLEKGY